MRQNLWKYCTICSMLYNHGAFFPKLALTRRCYSGLWLWKILFFLLLMLLRSICHQVSNQSDNFESLPIIINYNNKIITKRSNLSDLWLCFGWRTLFNKFKIHVFVGWWYSSAWDHLILNLCCTLKHLQDYCVFLVETIISLWTVTLVVFGE